MTRLAAVAALLACLLIGWGARADEASVAKGEYLARAGDCVACHSEPGGKAFAGGMKMATPVGTITVTNITPDVESGIGSYTLGDFDRAVRRGVARDGHHLYPAMPYPSYARMTDADVAALYEYFMHGVPAVRRPNAANAIPFLLSPRWPLAIWDEMFAPESGFTPDPGRDAQVNRGAYLVEGLGHCGACHTPRGWAWQEKALDAKDGRFLAGATLDDWYAPNLRRNLRTGLGAWSQAEIVAFLKTGHNARGAAYGSMRDVINNSTPYLTDADLAAMAAYLAGLAPSAEETAYAYDGATAAALTAGRMEAVGAAVYAAACQSCHRETGGSAPPFVPPLAGNPTVLDADPASLINIVLNGSAPLVVRGRPDAYRMPQFREQLTNREIADVVSFIRDGWGNKAPSVSVEAVAALRRRSEATSDRVVLLRMR